MKGGLESDYLLFLDGKAIGVLEAKPKTTKLNEVVAKQAENYTHQLLDWYQYWEKPLPLIYLSNGRELLFKNAKRPEDGYKPLSRMHSPSEMAELAGVKSYFTGLPALSRAGLRDCQYDAVKALEDSFRAGCKRALIVLATGAGKTYTACLAAYRLLTYTPARRILFLVDRNNLGIQAESEFGTFRLTESGDAFNQIYTTVRLKDNKIPKDTNLAICTIQRLFSVITGTELQDSDDDESGEDDADQPDVSLDGKQLLIPHDFFDAIIVDECHRSIYGRWKKVLEYFNTARVIGLTYTASSSATVRAVYVTLQQDVKAGDALMRLSSGQTVEAEFDGRINQLYVAEGDKVSAGANLVQVVDFEHMQVSVRVDEYDISSVHAGDECRVATVATEKTFTSTIDSINYVSSSAGSVAYYSAIAYVDVEAMKPYRVSHLSWVQ